MGSGGAARPLLLLALAGLCRAVRQRGADPTAEDASTAAARLRARAWDGRVPWEASNIAGIGGEEDRALRRTAAAAEAAWQGLGHEPALLVWRIEDFEVVPWNASLYGSFHTGDSYVVLHTERVSERLVHHIFFWLGRESSIDEKGTAAYKTVELDDYLDGMSSQTREVQGKESKQFLALFPKLTYLAGGVDSGFHHVISSTFQARLFHVRKTQHGTVQLETSLTRDSMNEGDSFVLDAGDAIYVYSGPEACPLERYEATILAKRLADRRVGRCEVAYALDDRAWALLGGRGPIPPASAGSDWIPPPEVEDGVLYRVQDTREGLHMDEVGRRKLRVEMLDSSHLMVLDHDTELLLWAGRGADAVERRNAFRTAFSFLVTNYRDLDTPIHMYKEGNPIKNQVWNTIFGH